MAAVRLLGWAGWWGGITGLAIVLFASHPIDLDEGVVLNAAWQIWHGQTLYTTVASFIPPGSAWWIATVWFMTGLPTYFVAKLAGIILCVSSLLGLVLIMVQLQQRAKLIWLTATALIWLLACTYYPLINHNSFSSFVAIWFTYALLLAQRRGWQWQYIWVGVLCGVVTLFLQTKGVMLLLAGIVMLWQWQRRQLGWYLLGYIFTLVPLILIWSPVVLFQHWWLAPFMANYLPQTIIDCNIVGLEILVTLVLVGYAWRKQQIDIWILSIIQLALFISSTNLIDIHHFMINLFPTIIIVLLAVEQWLPQHYRWFGIGYGLVLLVVVGVVIHKNWSTSNTIFEKIHPGESGLAFPELKTAQFIYAGPFLPNLYFEFNKPNPFTMTDNMTLCTPTCHEAMYQTFLETKPEFAFLAEGMVAKYGYDVTADLIDVYIKNHYQHCDYGHPDIQLYVRDHCPAWFPKFF